jgi:AraC family transcriptional regulator
MDTLPDVHSPAVVFHKRATWDHLRVEHDRVRRGEIPEHRHKEHLVVIALEGASEAELRTEGVTHIHEKPPAGGVLVLPAGIRHSARFVGESEYFSIYLDPAFFSRVVNGTAESNHVEIIEKSVVADPVISQVGMALRDEIESEGVGGRLYVESLANLLAVHLLRNYTAPQTARVQFRGGLAGHKLRRATGYIAENSHQSLTLEKIAGEVGMSPFHFAREFKKATGYAPHQYLLNDRIDRARKLLAASDLPIVDIALQTGFQSQSHFTRVFRRVTAFTPGAYRELNRK